MRTPPKRHELLQINEILNQEADSLIMESRLIRKYKETLERKTFYLIATMQQSFLRHKVLKQSYGIDLTVPEERKAFHRAILHDILEV